MCESKVYMRDGTNDKKIADEAVTVLEEDGSVIVVGLFGERLRIEDTRIVEIDARKHVIYLRRISNDEGIQA
ncbi:MAG: CooT family nickel-binding protein [Candidatus Hydrothermarchaeaceae archaeon]